MSRIVHFDCSSGASGDMILGALVDLGWPVTELQRELSRLPLRGYRIEARKVERSGLAATKVDVILLNEDASDGAPASGRHHGHGSGQPHENPHGPDQPSPYRHLPQILGLLASSGLDDGVKERCQALFQRLAEAEAAVHGTRPEAVHFHEVGAVDSIVDIVGGVIGLSRLGATRFTASPLNVGGGTVAMAHGVLPVPPPATARLVTGVPVYGAGDTELLTPTGALLVTAHATAYGALPAMRLSAVGYGAGSREVPGRPNVLRLLVGEETAPAGSESVLVLETHLDDVSPQWLGALLERLLEAGALDVYYTAIQMKKSRPGILITVLARPEHREPLEELLFAESTTLGVRRRVCERTLLDREVVRVKTPYGVIGVKLGRRGQRVYNAQPEFDDCLAAARGAGVAVKEVWTAALMAWRGTEGR